MEEKKVVFDAEAASRLVEELRGGFTAGKTRTYEWRMSQLKGIMKIVEDHEQEIVEALRSDLSKPELEAVIYEVSMVNSACSVAIKKLKQWMMAEKVKTSITTFPSSAEIVPEPLGVVLVIAPWNYPFLLSIEPVIGAIAAGNAVVLKPSEVAPASSSLLAKLFRACMDNSLIRVVQGAVPETTALLEQKWDKICYTEGKYTSVRMVNSFWQWKNWTGCDGSCCKAPYTSSTGTWRKMSTVVDSGINLHVASRRIVAGKWGCNSGQTCVAPDYILTTKDYAPKLVDALKHTLEEFYGKNQLESKDLSRIVNSNHFSRLIKLLDEDQVSGKIVHGGERDKSNLRISPTILLDVPRDSMIMNEEIFGPLLPILTKDYFIEKIENLVGENSQNFYFIHGEINSDIPFCLKQVEKVEDSFDIINSGTKPLAAYLFTNNKELKEQFVMTVSAGGMLVNDTVIHLGVDTLPFGGVQESGMGSYHGKFSFDAFTHKKAVLCRGFAGDAPVRYPPYTKGKIRLVKALICGTILGIISALMGLSKD
ncbi:Aldehyde dehydrogenase family 3 member H1 [Morella rubra]|uniref:Aldehyde dehydrogenase n=1 Tax=Morella rubra TaxID=262757 RepID=A0A6A1W774_9ROSI|nr:Aldehyde dehydrogenase family 3 member H1 [Morella rubra]